MSEYPWNKKNNIFTWLSSHYNPFKTLIWEAALPVGIEATLVDCSNIWQWYLSFLFIYPVRQYWLTFCVMECFYLNLMSDNAKTCPHNANELNINPLILHMLQLCNLCNVLKCDTQERISLEICKKIIGKLL